MPEVYTNHNKIKRKKNELSSELFRKQSFYIKMYALMSLKKCLSALSFIMKQ